MDKQQLKTQNSGERARKPLAQIKRNPWLRIWKLLNIFAITGAFAACWYLFYADDMMVPFFARGNWVVIVLFMVFYLLFARIYAAFSVSLMRIRELAYSQSLAIGLSNVLIYVVISLISHGFVAVLPLLVTMFAQMLIAIIWSYCAHSLYYRRFKPADTVVIWDSRQGLEEKIKEYNLYLRFNVTKSVYIADCMQDIGATLQGAKVVFLYGIRSGERNDIVKYCVKNGVKAYVIPCVGDLLMKSAIPVNMMHLPVYMLQRHSPGPEYRLIKRVFDLIASAIALLILSPLMLVVALLVRRDGGPAFYKQTRLTKDGKTFKLIKFRSMRTDAEKDGVARLSTGENDDRITPVGRWIRRFRVDELPQFLNVLRGDLSIVGPRPERPEIAEKYEEEIPEFALRLQVKAGITGYAQVYGKYNTTAYDKLLLDLHYISKASVYQDLQIMLATVKILFEPESTEGVEVGQTTAIGESEHEKVGV